MSLLSKNFPESEFIHSRTAARLGIDNRMNKSQRSNAKRLANKILQPYRDHIKQSVSVTSGFRCKTLNAVISGSSSTSYHMEACAGDIRDSKYTPEQCVNWMLENVGEHIDCIIYEFGSWVHVQVAKPGKKPRGKVLTAYRKNGKTYYKNGLHPELCK